MAQAYGISAVRVAGTEAIAGLKDAFHDNRMEPQLIEVMLGDHTVVSPKLEFGKPNQDQEPLLDRKLYEYLMNL